MDDKLARRPSRGCEYNFINGSSYRSNRSCCECDVVVTDAAALALVLFYRL